LRKRILITVLSLVLLTAANSVVALDAEYPVVYVDFKELTIMPEDFSELTFDFPLFSNEPALVSLLSLNNTLFWESIGNYDMNLTENSTVSSFLVVQINNTGFYQTLVGLSADNQSLEWIYQLDTSISENFSTVVKSATEYFSDDGRYWGLCEEIVVIPGALAGRSEALVWRLKFHLVAEAEEWTLFIDSSGDIVDLLFSTIPCQTCPDYSVYAIVGVTGVIIIIFAAVLLNSKRT
jgi:hypothetical protein